jgi:O-methyltransferase
MFEPIGFWHYMLPGTPIAYLIHFITQTPPGWIVAAGVYQGGDVMALRQAFPSRPLAVIDSFCGLNDPGRNDSPTAIKGVFDAKGIDTWLRNWREVGVRIPDSITVGHIDPTSLPDISPSFLWLDLDHYQPTIDCLRWFAPKMVKGGIIVTDDYGFEGCPGIKIACQEYAEGQWEQGWCNLGVMRITH